jgi:DNA transformation protein
MGCFVFLSSPGGVMAVSAAYLESLHELFGFVPEFRIKRMFGGAGVVSGELMFAVVFEEDLFLRADDETRPAFLAVGSDQFVYATRDGEQMSLGYWRAPGEVWDDPDAAQRWTRLGLEAAARKKQASKRSKKPKKAPELLISGPWDEA